MDEQAEFFACPGCGRDDQLWDISIYTEGMSLPLDPQLMIEWDSHGVEPARTIGIGCDCGWQYPNFAWPKEFDIQAFITNEATKAYREAFLRELDGEE